MISDARADVLWRCFVCKLSGRASAIEAGVDKKTVLRYFKQFSSSGRPVATRQTRVKKPIPVKTIKIEPESWERIEMEASERTLTSRELIGEIINTVARDGLFSAIIDD